MAEKFTPIIHKPSIPKKCKCGKYAVKHWDNGLYCGDNMCDECFEKMRKECKRRSW